jgi:hypothetical protein
VGTNFIRNKSNSFYGSTTGGLAIPGLFSLANSRSYVGPQESLLRFEKFGAYGQLSLDYDRFVFIEASYRQDKSSALPSNNNSYGYYSVGVASLCQNLLRKTGYNFLNYVQVML